MVCSGNGEIKIIKNNRYDILIDKKHLTYNFKEVKCFLEIDKKNKQKHI